MKSLIVTDLRVKVMKHRFIIVVGEGSLLEHFLEVLQKHTFSLLPQIHQDLERIWYPHGSGFLRKPDPIFRNSDPDTMVFLDSF